MSLALHRTGVGMTSARTRDRLIERLEEAGIRDPRVLDAIRRTPRHLFIEEALASRAYEDSALPIGHAQTISQPYIVARMTEALIEAGVPDKVLEIGTGSGYQAAILAAIVPKVATVERINELLIRARQCFAELKLHHVSSKYADGMLGWRAQAPFGGIVITAAATGVPEALFDQLDLGGRLIAPVGRPAAQELIRYTKTATGVRQEKLGPVSFVPLLPGLSR
jgi:protein-L-isoaspartate(D-aspartate) O-methyltransferase